MQFLEYPEYSDLTSSHYALIDASSDQTSTIPVADLALLGLDLNGNMSSAALHRAIPRGKSLGSSFTSTQQSAISAGTFDDLWLGDYWTIDSVNWRIADFDYWYNNGSTYNCTTHHLVIVPDKNLDTQQMNSSNTTEGGYVGSEMYTTNMETAKDTIISAFTEDHLLTHEEYLVNTVTDGYSSAGAWVDSTIELMNEPMVYGSYIRAHRNAGTNVPISTTNSKTQLALFQHCPRMINIRSLYWLRDVVSSTHFAHVCHYGYATTSSASSSIGVRPVFAIY